MTQLNPKMHPMLSSEVIQLLNENEIYTLVEFLREDEDKLIQFMKIPGNSKQILSTRRYPTLTRILLFRSIRCAWDNGNQKRY